MKKHFLVNAEISNEEPFTDLSAMLLSPPGDGEEEIVEEIQGLVDTSNECIYQVGPRGGARPAKAHVGFNEKDGNLPRDGDFFELNDLPPLLDSDEMLERRSGEQESWPTSGYNDGCFVSELANAGNLQRFTEDVQVRPLFTSWSLDSYGQPRGESTMGLYGAVSGSCSIGREELEYKDIPDLFKNFNALAALERESCNSEFDEDRLLTDCVQNERLVVSQAGSEERDEQYLDAQSSFSDMVDMNLLNLGLSSFETTDDQALLWKPWAAKREGSVPLQLDTSTIARASCIDMATRNNCAAAQMSPNHQGLHSDKADTRRQAAKGSDGRGTSSKAFGVILHCLESLPILPASAADMSSRSGTPLGSISVLASSLDIRAVAINCSCVNKGAALSCMTCSFEKRGTFVRSLSYTGGKMVVEGSSTSLLVLGIIAAIWVFFWFLLLGGSWKLFGGAFRLIFSE